MRTVIIFNPTAGRGRGETTALAVQENLKRSGHETELQPTAGPRDASRIAAEWGEVADVLVAVGGDGTINEVINGMTGAACSAPPKRPARTASLGIVPAGTVNVLALELGIPSQVERACAVITAGNTMSLDLGRVGSRRFVLMMGAGIDALTIRNIDLKAKKRFHEWAFVGTGLRAGFAQPPSQFLVRVEGQEHRVTFFVAGNAHYYGGRFGVTPNADPTDGLLDLMLFRGTTRSSMAVFWLEVPSSLHLQNPNVLCLSARKAELLPLDDDRPIWFQTDGELSGRLPATVEIDHQAIEIHVP